jgi:nitrite reductase/ring-hydroxylating ferredoxin subunit
MLKTMHTARFHPKTGSSVTSPASPPLGVLSAEPSRNVPVLDVGEPSKGVSSAAVGAVEKSSSSAR